MNKKLVAFLIILGLVLPCYAAVENIKVGGDISAVGVWRHGFNLRKPKSDESGIASIVRLRLDADLTDNVSAVVRLLNERPWGMEGEIEDGTDIDLDLAYLTLKEFLYSPLSLNVGRQNIKLGSGLLVGDPDTNQLNLAGRGLTGSVGDLSARKAFDGVVATLDYSPVIVTAGMVKGREGRIGVSGDDVNAYLVSAAYDFGTLGTVGELSYVVKEAKKTDVNNYGVRLTSNPLENLTTSGEFVYQTRKGIRADRKASQNTALLLAASYSFPEIMWQPSLSLDYTRLGKNWDVMFEDLTPADIVNALLPNTNAQVIGLTGSAQPVEDVTLKLRYANVRLVERIATLTTPWRRTISMARKKDIGDEIDLTLTYDYTEDVQLGVSAGWFNPGRAFPKASRKSASQLIASMKVTF